MLTATTTSQAYGALLLRLALGTMWVAHALLKLVVFSLPGFGAWLASQGIPAFMAWPVFLIELIGGVAIVLGFYGRYVSAALVPVMLVAAWTHLSNGWLHTSPGGGWEYPIFLAVASVAHFLIGDGTYALTGETRTSGRQAAMAI